MKYRVVNYIDANGGISDYFIGDIIELEPIEELKPKPTYKVGDLVRVVSSNSCYVNHYIPISTIVVIAKDIESNGAYLCRTEDMGDYYVHGNDLEPYTEQDDSFLDTKEKEFYAIAKERSDLIDKVKELEEEQYVVSGNKSIQAKLDMFTNALIYIKNKGYDINDSTGNALGYIAQQALMASNDVKEGQWGVREMECILCEKKWVAVFPIECTELECPNCNKLNQIED